MDTTSAVTLVVLATMAVIALTAIVRAIRDDQRTWAIGITLTTALLAPVGVVLAITYLGVVRRRLGLR